jgi:hypothetical protein
LFLPVEQCSREFQQIVFTRGTVALSQQYRAQFMPSMAHCTITKG